MYSNDYDDMYPLSDTGCLNSQFPSTCIGWGYGPPDSVPAQVMYPYTKNFDITINPMSDLGSIPGREQAQFSSLGSPWYPPTIAQGTTQQLQYAAGVRSNYGYNFAFFSPWIYNSVTSYIGSQAESASSVTQPAHTLMWGGPTVWNTVGGSPTGGGNWVIQTPCWTDANGNYLQPFAALAASGLLQSYGGGWDPVPGAWDVYGGLWPFYTTSNTQAAAGAQNGQVIIGFADSHVKSMAISQVAAGCSAYGESALKGTVTDPTKFIWATNQ